ncbi:hypothetical protein ATEIFO6365_0004093000 [Aspergillus terreus]|uniref:Uncharacterized protein n=1 Tax=Aspergillus terreus TaxID=33178 RepID=A0A5M3YS24_ASPTE|nr:hypothetical protein ATETN484_0002095500 [Aspergillus terreus]GFF15810.1 hypothetical protein ATEIFO6365_0004093000 [Aspergillus terreus]
MHHTWIYISLTGPPADPPPPGPSPKADSQLANLPRPPGHLAARTSPSLAPPRQPPRSLGGSLPQPRGPLRACSPPPLTETPAPTGQPRPSAAARGPQHPPSTRVSDPRPGGLAPPPLGAKPPKGGGPLGPSAPSRARHPPGHHHRPPGPGGAPLYATGYGYATATGGVGRPSDRPPIDSPTSLGPSSCETEFRGPKVAGGERFLYGVVRAFSQIPYKLGRFFSPPNPPKIVLSAFRRAANWPAPGRLPKAPPAKVARPPTGHGPSRRDAPKTPRQLASPRPRPRRGRAVQDPRQLAGRARRRRRPALSLSSPRPRPPANW